MEEIFAAISQAFPDNPAASQIASAHLQRFGEVYKISGVSDAISSSTGPFQILNLQCDLASGLDLLVPYFAGYPQRSYTGIDKKNVVIRMSKQRWGANPQFRFFAADATNPQQLKAQVPDLNYQSADIVLLHQSKPIADGNKDLWRMLLHTVPLYAKPNAMVLLTACSDYDMGFFNSLFHQSNAFPEIYASTQMYPTIPENSSTPTRFSSAPQPYKYYAVLRVQPTAYKHVYKANYGVALTETIQKIVMRAAANSLEQHVNSMRSPENLKAIAAIRAKDAAELARPTAQAKRSTSSGTAALASSSSAPPSKPSFGFGFAGSKKASKKKPVEPERTLATVLPRYKLKRDQKLPSPDLALRRAANSGQASDVAFLLDHGADPMKTTSKGASAMDLALAGKSKPRTVDALLRHGDPSVRLNYIFMQNGLLEHLQQISKDRPIVIASLGCGSCYELPVLANLCKRAGVKFKYYGLDNDANHFPKNYEDLYPAELHEIDASNRDSVARVLQGQQVDILFILNPLTAGLADFWWMFTKTIPLFATPNAFILTTLASKSETKTFENAFASTEILRNIFAKPKQGQTPQTGYDSIDHSCFRLELQTGARKFVEAHSIEIFLAVRAITVKAFLEHVDNPVAGESAAASYRKISFGNSRSLLLHSAGPRTNSSDAPSGKLEAEFKDKPAIAALFSKYNLPYPENPKDFLKALHRAAFLGNCADIKFLVERYGVDITETNDHGKNAIDYASEGENTEALQLLKLYRQKVTRKTKP